MYKIDISKVKDIISVCPKSINLMLEGNSGIGKTTVVEEYCKENGIYLKTLILSQLDASEALGIPTVVDREFNGKTYRSMEEAIPAWVFDLASHDRAMLFLDEFLCSEPSVMNSFLNLLSQKRVHDIDLSHVQFIAATNIGMYTYEPDFNILTRFCFFHVVNTTYKKDYPFVYEYNDNSECEGTIFEPRPLVPRCAESLRDVPVEYLDKFYQGFTNTDVITDSYSVGLKFSKDISLIVSQFASKNSESGKYEVKDELVKAMATVLYRKYKRSYEKVIESITILTEAQIKFCLNEFK